MKSLDDDGSDESMPTMPPTIDEQIAQVERWISIIIRDIAWTGVEHEGTNPDPEVSREIQSFKAVTRTLRWAKKQPGYPTSGVSLTDACRNELKGLEAAALTSEQPEVWWRNLGVKEVEYGVYDSAARYPRWQD